MMKPPPLPSVARFFHFSIYLGPLAFLFGIVIVLFGEVSNQTNTVLSGLILTAAGLIVWGCHGIRRRGKRPGFILMSSLGSSFFLLHLYYRYSDYRWAKINTMSFENATSATMAHLESRVVLFISVLLVSALIGLLPPLPAPRRINRPRYDTD